MAEEVIIPELEEIIQSTGLAQTDWSPEELAILNRYYGQPGITIRTLMKYLPGRTYSAIQSKVVRLALAPPRIEDEYHVRD